MRTTKEIALAINLLDQHGGEHKRAQMGVLKDRMTESQVFDTYVSNYAGDGRNEALYFAVRDAAKYVAGKLAIEELVPDLPDGAPDEPVKQQKEEEKITLTLSEFNGLLKRVSNLELQVKGLMQPKDEVNQSEARKYIGCSEDLLRQWTKAGKVQAAPGKGKQLIYRISELSHNATVQEYWKKRKQKP